ncbi:MAG: FkbM family methyltransferase [Proteobacteria bacterium]|nr:FkbM family methyltransferase [Pseudomonadota bacterium]
MSLADFLLERGAELPPLFKSRFLMRLFSRLIPSSDRDTSFFTNLGIDSCLKVELDKRRDFDPLLAFGKPIHHKHERGALYLCDILFPLCDSFIDIGANYGIFSYFLSRREQRKPLFLFEPNPRLSKILLNSALRNKKNNFIIKSEAVGSASGKLRFWLNWDDESQSSLKQPSLSFRNCEEVEVDVISMDEFFTLNPKLVKSLVKVDIENAEFDFLAGARGSLGRISYLVMEVLLPAVQQGFIRKMISEQGFYAYYIDDFNLRFSKEGDFDYSPGQLNWLFCKLDPDLLAQTLKKSRFKVL